MDFWTAVVLHSVIISPHRNEGQGLVQLHNMEKFPAFNDEKEESAEEGRISLYPERVSSSYVKVIEDIQRLESGEGLKEELDSLEKQELLEFEEQYAQQLDGVYQLQGKTFEYYPPYFETDEGRDVLGKLFPGEGVDELDVHSIHAFLYKNRERLNSLATEDRGRVGRASVAHAYEVLKKSLTERLDVNNEFSVEGFENPKFVTVVINPVEVETKLKGLRELKRDIKASLGTVVTGDRKIERAKEMVLDMYRVRINELIASLYPDALSIQEIAREFGEGSLSDSEREILKRITVSSDTNLSSRRARLDKFRYGASQEYGDGGVREQVSSELLLYADELEAEWEQVEKERAGKIESRGLDPRKLEEKNISKEQRKEWGERILASYGLLSIDDSTDPTKRTLDDKWRYVPEENRKTMSVNRKRKVVLDKWEETSVTHTFPVALAHEIEGHVLQSANREHIPLALFKFDIGADRGSVYSEGGAMYNQNIVSQELFGYEQLPKPHYVRAMARRLEGGSYLDCVKAYYESALKPFREAYEREALSKKEFDKKARALIKTSLSSARRLFRDTSPSAEGSFLISSKDTAYLEQRKLVEGLKAAGLLKLAYVGGLNLENARELMRFGLLDLERMQEPKFETVKIWEEEKEKYASRLNG